MIHPTRTNLLQLKEKASSVSGSITILKARRQALIKEFLQSSEIFLQTREEIKSAYRKALVELHLTQVHEGTDAVESLAVTGKRSIGIGLQKRNIMGVKFWEVTVNETIPRTPPDRHYNYFPTSFHTEEAFLLFEKVADTIMRIAAHENKLKRLGDEILQILRRTRVMEERVLPGLKSRVKAIEQYLSERERESYFRLKRFKELRSV